MASFFWILRRHWRILIKMPARLITVAETPLFVSQAKRVWSDAEREEFVDFIAGNPEAADLIPETGGVRKIRWSKGRLRQAGRGARDLLSPRRQSAAVSAADLR